MYQDYTILTAVSILGSWASLRSSFNVPCVLLWPLSSNDRRLESRYLATINVQLFILQSLPNNESMCHYIANFFFACHVPHQSIPIYLTILLM
jgi:hypothetical protein